MKRKLAIFCIPDRKQRQQLLSLGLELKPREGGEWLVLGGKWRVKYDDAGFVDSYEFWRSGEYVGRVFTLGSTSSFVLR